MTAEGAGSVIHEGLVSPKIVASFKLFRATGVNVVDQIALVRVYVVSAGEDLSISDSISEVYGVSVAELYGRVSTLWNIISTTGKRETCHNSHCCETEGQGDQRD